MGFLFKLGEMEIKGIYYWFLGSVLFLLFCLKLLLFRYFIDVRWLSYIIGDEGFVGYRFIFLFNIEFLDRMKEIRYKS